MERLREIPAAQHFVAWWSPRSAITAHGPRRPRPRSEYTSCPRCARAMNESRMYLSRDYHLQHDGRVDDISLFTSNERGPASRRCNQVDDRACSVPPLR